MNDDLLPWRLYDKLTLGEAAFLLCGVDPNSGPNLDRPPRYVAWVDQMQGAIRQGLPETMRVEGSGGITGGVILVKDLRDWLKGIGVSTGFFFDAPVDIEAQKPNGPPVARNGVKNRISIAIDDAVARLVKNGKKPSADEVFTLLRRDDKTGTIVDSGEERGTGRRWLVWEDHDGNNHDIQYSTIANKLSKISIINKKLG